MSLPSDNIILRTDSYKASHFLQYPPGTTRLLGYFESRGGLYGETVFFGLQYLLEEYLSRRVTDADVTEAAAFFAAHGLPFPEEGWRYIARDLDGRLPVRIRAVPEGSVVPVRNALMTVESTDERVPWIVSWLETQLVRLWYPLTVATLSWHIKRRIFEYLARTSDDPLGELPYKLHDFGARGVSSAESAGIGGMAHLVNFRGSDTVEGVMFARRYYGAEMAGVSIPAAEHSTVTAWGRERERDAYRNFVERFLGPGKYPIAACVSDSYDLWNAIETIWCEDLRDLIEASGSTLVIRPDSGDPGGGQRARAQDPRAKGRLPRQRQGVQGPASLLSLDSGRRQRRRGSDRSRAAGDHVARLLGEQHRLRHGRRAAAARAPRHPEDRLQAVRGDGRRPRACRSRRTP